MAASAEESLELQTPGSCSAEEVSAPAPASPRDLEREEEQLVPARAAKQLGNEAFKAGKWEDAADHYSDAIDMAPPLAEEGAVFFANRAACYSKLGHHQDCVDDCTSALTLQPEYVKALLRRAQAREALDLPSEALEDMRKVVELDPSCKVAVAAVPRLEAAANAKLEQQKEEMLGKLKELGNSVLGRFGMSLDNFKADKDPSTGSYNISFQR